MDDRSHATGGLSDSGAGRSDDYAQQQQQQQRIDSALSSLIDAFLPPASDEDEDIEDQRRVAAYERSKHLIDGYTPTSSPLSTDPTYTSDLIKKHLLRENSSPEKAVRFARLYNRLLSQPVLSQKAAILYLLHQLSDFEQDSSILERQRRPPQLLQQQQQQQQQQARPTSSSRSQPAMAYLKNEGLPPRTPDSRMGTWPPQQTPSERIPHLAAHTRLPSRPGTPPRPSSKRTQESGTSLSESDEFYAARTPPPPTAGEKAVVVPAAGALPPTTAAHAPMQPPPTEAALLRDLPFTLQGLSSTNLHFTTDGSLLLPPNAPLPVVALLHLLAEPSLLYRELSAFIQTSDGGLIGQSLRAAVEAELRDYLELVATLERRIRRALGTMEAAASTAAAGTATGASSPVAATASTSGHLGKAGVTLKRCVVWTRETTLGLRLMAVMVEQSRHKKGGQLISLIHSFSSSHGDPFVGAFAERLLTQVTRPFYDMLRRWIYDGELSDPYCEFFVSEREPRAAGEASGVNATDSRGRGMSGGGGAATSVWEDKYRLEHDMIPTLMTQDLARKIFLIGKSLNFIRYGCGDSAWVEKYSKEKAKELRYGDTAMLEASIDEAYKSTMARLMHLMTHKFKLLEHLRALKRYLLLGQGDFIALLIESLSASLDRPANTLFRHSLTAQLEHAIRGSNAQFDAPDVLRRLDARMLLQGHGDIGWDCFTLEYKVEAPIDVIVTPDGGREYLKVFNFLWRIKRVEFALGSTWRRCMTGARGVLAAVADRVGGDWRLARCCIAEMIHFVGQLQYYILFEVIQASWDQLEAAVSKSDSTLDDLIGAHARYLQAITHKGLLGAGRASGRPSSSAGTGSGSGSGTGASASATVGGGGGGGGGGGSSTGREENFLVQLHEILKLMLAYRDAVDGLYSFSVAEFTRRQGAHAKMENASRAADGGAAARPGHRGAIGARPEQGGGGGARRAKRSSAHAAGAARTTAAPAPVNHSSLGGSGNSDVAEATPSHAETEKPRSGMDDANGRGDATENGTGRRRRRRRRSPQDSGKHMDEDSRDDHDGDEAGEKVEGGDGGDQNSGNDDDDNDDDDEDGRRGVSDGNDGNASHGNDDGDDDDEDSEEGHVLSALRQRLSGVASDFRARINLLLGDLAHQPDVDMRFLGVVMNFNDVYTPVRRKARKDTGHHHHSHQHEHHQQQQQPQQQQHHRHHRPVQPQKLS